MFPLQDEIENMVRQAEQHAQEDSGMYLIDFLNVLIKTREIIISNYYFFPLQLRKKESRPLTKPKVFYMTQTPNWTNTDPNLTLKTLQK